MPQGEKQMDVFEKLQDLLKTAKITRKYNWDAVVAYIKKRGLVTASEIAKVARLRHHRLAYQWCERHVKYVVDLDTRKQTMRNEDGFLVRVQRLGNVFYMHVDNVER